MSGAAAMPVEVLPIRGVAMRCSTSTERGHPGDTAEVIRVTAEIQARLPGLALIRNIT